MRKRIDSFDIRALIATFVGVPILIGSYCLLIPATDHDYAGGSLFELRTLVAIASLCLIVFVMPCLLAVIAKRRPALWSLLPYLLLLAASCLARPVSDMFGWSGRNANIILRFQALAICIGSMALGLMIRWLVLGGSGSATIANPASPIPIRYKGARRVRLMVSALLAILPLAAVGRFISAQASVEELYALDVGQCDASCVKLLISLGADVKARDPDGRTALMCDVDHFYWCDPGSLKFLIRSGADVNARDKHGRTALMDAAKTNHADCVKVLISRGAKLNTRDDCGTTAIMYAASNDSASSAKLLIAAGADLEARNAGGKTALDLAEQNSSTVAKLLRATNAK
jgi:hypothetical protein